MPRGIPNKRRVTGKDAVSASVSDVGRALVALVQSLKEHGKDLSQDEFDRAFSHLYTSLGTLDEQARRDRKLVAAENFSFETSVVPSSYIPPIYMSRPPAFSSNTSRGKTGVPEQQPTPAWPLPPTSFEELDPSDFGAMEEVKPVKGAAVVAPAGKPAWQKPTGRVSRHSPDPEAGKAVHVPFHSDQLLGGVADAGSDILFLNEEN